MHWQVFPLWPCNTRHILIGFVFEKLRQRRQESFNSVKARNDCHLDVCDSLTTGQSHREGFARELWTRIVPLTDNRIRQNDNGPLWMSGTLDCVTSPNKVKFWSRGKIFPFFFIDHPMFCRNPNFRLPWRVFPFSKSDKKSLNFVN